MTAYWVLLLAVLVVASIVLLAALNRGKNSGTDSSKGTTTTVSGTRTTGTGISVSEIRTTGTGTTGSGTRTTGTVTAGPGTRTTGTGTAGTGIKTTGTAGAGLKTTSVVKKYTTVYAYKPTRSTVRCKICDGENLMGTSLCCICGNYLN